MPQAPTKSDQGCVDRYAGPYERWVFSKDLGRPYAFPLIAKGHSTHFTALLEGGNIADLASSMPVRLPPLWRASETTKTITPFAFEQSIEADGSEDAAVAGCLSAMHATLTSDPSRSQAVVPRFRVNFPIVKDTWVGTYRPDDPVASWTTPGTPPKAIIAVIDDGLPFAHRAFLGSDGRTRLSYCWLQSGLAQSPAQVPFGREYANGDIDLLRQQFGDDEAQLYRHAAAIQSGVPELGTHLRRHATHGSHVLGLAAGNDSLFGAHALGDDIQIIAVQLPNTIAWDTSGFGKEMYMLSALHYVFDRASRIAQACGVDELPLILNFSYGWSAGRHDGGSEMEIAIHDLLDARKKIQPKTEIVMPTGNNFASRMHTRFGETEFVDNAVSLDWRLQPDDHTSSYLELWFPDGFDPTGYSVELTAPAGETLDTPANLDVSPDSGMTGGGDPRRFLEVVSSGKTIGQMSADKHRNSRWRVMIALIPTVYTRNQDRRLPSGQWRLTLKRDTSSQILDTQQDIQVWVQRDDDPSDLKSHGRQSYLTELSSQNSIVGENRPKSPLRRMTETLPVITGYGALNAVASSVMTTRVAGYTAQTRRVSDYSGAGGLRQDTGGTVTTSGAQVDLAAVSDHSMMLPGIASLGVLSGARARLVGTSGAAPSAARLMVINAAAGRDVFDGFLPPLEKYRTEIDTPSVRLQHAARVGTKTARSVSRSG